MTLIYLCQVLDRLCVVTWTTAAHETSTINFLTLLSLIIFFAVYATVLNETVESYHLFHFLSYFIKHQHLQQFTPSLGELAFD